MIVNDILRARGWLAVTIDSSAPLAAAIRVMRREGVAALAVSDDGRRIDGIVTDREISGAFRLFNAEDLMDKAVCDVMSRTVMTCSPDDDLRRLASRMAGQRVRHAVVVDDHGAWGVVSLTDILEHRLSAAERDIVSYADRYRIAS